MLASETFLNLMHNRSFPLMSSKGQLQQMIIMLAVAPYALVFFLSSLIRCVAAVAVVVTSCDRVVQLAWPIVVVVET